MTSQNSVLLLADLAAKIAAPLLAATASLTINQGAEVPDKHLAVISKLSIRMALAIVKDATID